MNELCWNAFYCVVYRKRPIYIYIFSQPVSVTCDILIFFLHSLTSLCILSLHSDVFHPVVRLVVLMDLCLGRKVFSAVH